MEVGGALASVLLGAFSLPCLLLLLVLGEAGLRVAALTLRRGEEGHHAGGWPTRSAFLGYRIARAGSSAFFRDGDEEPPLLPPECCDRLALAVHRRGPDPDQQDECCAFCLSAVRDGDETRDLRCRHVFHRACIDAWLVRPRATCPLCRDRLLPADDDHPPSTTTASDDDDAVVYGYGYGYGYDALSSSPSSSSRRWRAAQL